jgi:hypothetical protein
MSLICIKCNRAIVLSDGYDHYGVCDRCDDNLTPEQEAKMLEARKERQEYYERLKNGS